VRTNRFTDLGANTMGLTWIDRVDAASTVDEVMDIARVYMAQITPGEVGALPQKCRPRKLFDTSDLTEFALDLVRETCIDPEPSPMVMKMAAVISHASTKITGLLAANEPDGTRTA
jgi:hypothetical protein